MNDLVDRLSTGRHPVEISLRPERTAQALKSALDRGYVHVKFTGTRGGTELGVPIDADRSTWQDVDFERGAGKLTVSGVLTLDYQKVRCTAEIGLPSYDGEGWLERVAE